ncbi:MAG: ABC transporter ATP-binding protein/permease [Oscillospiraceae bacterium]|jgi:ABC-type multidrug transport system fused ATPase/permease subunit|nr:ABC transporter ATP-binding protein/permease [Oscillospiraceae bacterium]
MKLLRQYIRLIRKIWIDAKGVLCLYSAFTIFGSIMPTIAAYSQKLFINSLENFSIFSAVVGFLVIYVVIKYLKSIYQYVDSFFAHKFIFKVKFIFNRYLTRRLYNESQENFFDPTFNDKLNKVYQGLENIPFQIFEINGIYIKVFVLAVIQIPLVITYSPILLLLIGLDSLFTILTAQKFSKAQYELEHKLTREQRKSNYYGSIFSSKANAKEIRIFGAQDFFYQNWIAIFKQLNSTRNAFNIYKQKIQILISLWNYILSSTLLIILFYQLLNKNIDFGTFTFLYYFIPAASAQFKDLIQSLLGDIYTNYLNIEHYVNYIGSEECDIKGTNKDIDFKILEIKNASYKYPTGKQYAIKNISLSIAKGEVVSILGYNGSGKTTLSKIMIGLLPPSEGSVCINGEDINKTNRHDVSPMFGIAYQDFTRYLLSVKDNIGFGYIERYNDDNIKKAFQEADGDLLLEKLPTGLETKLGKAFYNDGIDLSGGEWQKIALARTYMGNHCVLLMDEPTASIDPMKEMEMLKHFKSVLKNRTAILISHRIGFARLADRIIMMNEGIIVESGSHEELLLKDGLYSKLFNSQKELYI